MLTSFALILLLGLFLGFIFSKMKLPSLLGMILLGIAIGPHGLNLIDESIMNIAGNLRQIALVIILTRAGLTLNIHDLKKVGRPAILLCFIPASIEIIGTILLAPLLLHVSVLEAALMGSVIAAVSPAVVVPRMIKLIEEGFGTKQSVPQMILAGASVDDVYVIVLFYTFLSLVSTGEMSFISFVQIPVSILLGIMGGILSGSLLIYFFNKNEIRDTVKVLILLSVSFLLLQVETSLKAYIPFSGLLAIMSQGILIKMKDETLAKQLSQKYNQLWIGAEVLLFVLVGAVVDLQYVKMAGIGAVILILGALCFRMLGAFISLLKTSLNTKERIFTMMAYTPKATVQAAIGAIPLSLGLSCGEVILTVAVLSILITAPFGAICIDNTYKKLLVKENKQ